MNILIIEDETVIRENTSEMLTLKGHNVCEAANGREALDKLKIFKPDFIFCDIMMPEMDGFQFIHEFRKLDQHKNIPFIFLSAKAENSDKEYGISLGANDFLIKPFSFTHLFEIIDKYA